MNLVARYSAILRYYSCYPPYSAIPFRGQLDVRYPPLSCLACKQNANAIGVCMGGIARQGAKPGKQRAIGYSQCDRGGYSACATKKMNN